MTMPPVPTNPEDRQRLAYELHVAGMGFDKIARVLNYAGPSGAYKAYVTYLEKMCVESAPQQLRLLQERIEHLWHGVFPAATSGNLKALDRAIKIAALEMKLLGLDRPVLVDQEALIRAFAHAHGMDEDAAVSTAQRLAAEQDW